MNDELTRMAGGAQSPAQPSVQAPPAAGTPPVHGSPPEMPAAGGDQQLKRPLIRADSDEDIAQQAQIGVSSVEEFFWGENGQHSFDLIAKRLKSAEDVPLEIADISENLTREIFNNGVNSGHLMDVDAARETLEYAIETTYSVAEDIGAYKAQDENEEQSDMMASMTYAGQMLFNENPPEGLEIDPASAEQMIAEVEGGAYDNEQSPQPSMGKGVLSRVENGRPG